MEAAVILGPILVGVGLLVLSVRELSRTEGERRTNPKKIGESHF